MIYGKAVCTHGADKRTEPERKDELHGGNECGWKISPTSLSDKVDVQKAEVSESDTAKIKRQLCHP